MCTHEVIEACRPCQESLYWKLRLCFSCRRRLPRLAHSRKEIADFHHRLSPLQQLQCLRKARGQHLSKPLVGEVGIDPEDQATSTGWSKRWLANLREAQTSSRSRSGSSSTTCSGVSPLASRSRTSLTRIRRPRMQGRPPHCSGSTVIRSAR